MSAEKPAWMQEQDDARAEAHRAEMERLLGPRIAELRAEINALPPDPRSAVEKIRDLMSGGDPR